MIRKLFITVFTVLLYLLASGCGKAPTSTSNTGVTPVQQPQHQSQPSATPLPTDTPQPSPTPTVTPSPTATPTPTLPPIGQTRVQPYPMSEVVHAPGWDVKVVEVKRGAEAWKAIKAANMFNDPPPEGREYLLVKIHVTSTATDDETHHISGCDFGVTGEHYILYTCDEASVVPPKPELEADLYAKGETEGWAAFAVGKDEHNLLLVVDPLLNFEKGAVRYIALEQDASVSIPADVLKIKPNNLGESRRKPASLSDTVITRDWQVKVLQVVRGDKAWEMVKKANEFNDPPQKGMEYVVVKVQVRYLGKKDEAVSIDEGYFSLSGAKGVEYDNPGVVAPKPALDVHLYPGGEYVGWVVLQCAQNEEGLILKFEPLFELSNENRRFISLEEQK